MSLKGHRMSFRRFAISGLLTASGLMFLLAGCTPQSSQVTTSDPAVQAGQTKFNQSCAGCHSASSLANSANRITNNLGTINPVMSGVTLTDDEVTNLKAFLALQ